MNVLKQPSGKQDQYISSYGGIKIIKIDREGKTNLKELYLDNNFIKYMEDNILLFFTGYSRRSSIILKEQETKTIHNSKNIISNLDFVKSIAIESIKSLRKKSLEDYGSLMREHWNYKIKRSKYISNSKINEIINLGLKNGAIGSKLVGAGGGGFIMFVCNDKKKLREKMAKKNIRELDFKFDFEGSTIIGR
jgi:D-glycero-alpha-D-manno-heptose-7-phosphate kinase